MMKVLIKMQTEIRRLERKKSRTRNRTRKTDQRTRSITEAKKPPMEMTMFSPLFNLKEIDYREWWVLQRTCTS